MLNDRRATVAQSQQCSVPRPLPFLCRQRGWQRACELPEEQRAARAASQLGRAGCDVGGVHIYTYNSPVAARTHSALAGVLHGAAQQALPLKWSGFLVHLQLSESIQEATAHIRNLQPIHLSSIQPDKCRQRPSSSGFIFPPYSCCAACLAILLSLARSSTFSDPLASHYV